MRLILASASPRRLELLRCVGADPVVLAVDLPEELLPAEVPTDTVVRLACEKATAAREHHASDLGPDLILAADTVVVLDGQVLGKPRDGSDARRMLTALSGRTHDVLTGVQLLRCDDGRSSAGFARTAVRFRELDAPTIDAYVRSGEPLDKAGSYGVQERGALLVAGIEGSWSNVVGLPLERLPGWLEAIGIAPGQLLPWLR